MEEIKRKLVKAAVIGRVVDDFNPHIKLNVFYGDKRISLGTQVSLAEVLHKPDHLQYRYDPDHCKFLGTLKNPILLTVVMTDPDAPGGEYLYWLSRHFIAAQQELVVKWQDLVTYEAPKPILDTHKIVFTVFKPKKSRPNIILPEIRENFSTRDFAYSNALGAPLAAAFFKINNQNENEDKESSTCKGYKVEEIKQKLVEAGVIGRVVDDFNPHIKLSVFYGDKHITLGTEVTPAEVQHKPDHLQYRYYPNHSKFLATLRNPILLTVVMTDPDAPGGEYLYWLNRDFVSAQPELEMHWQELVTYEAPSPMDTDKIVFTVFKQNESRPNIILPGSRWNFSTRDFAYTNALGPPLAAAFFKINNQNKNDDKESHTCNGHVL